MTASSVRRVRLGAVAVLVVGLVVNLVGTGTWSAFSATSANAAAFAAGTVTLADNDGGVAAVSLSGARPGDVATGCVTVTYAGSLPAGVRIYGTAVGALAPYLTLAITRGSDPTPSAGSCATFAPDATDHVGAGPGVVFSGPLSSLPATWVAGVADPAPATPETWTTSEARTYRIRITLAADPAAQGRSATASFVWEARNL